MNKIIVISNDKIFLNKNNLSTKYNDTINILSALQKCFDIYLISNINKIKNNFSLNTKKKLNDLILNSFSDGNKKNKIINDISYTRNLFFILVKSFFKNLDGYLYLRSDGYQEYESKIGKIGYLIYGLMLKYLEQNLKIISVSKYIKCSTKILNYTFRLDNLCLKILEKQI